MKSEFISRVADKLSESNLPPIITKEQLINHYLHHLKIGRMTEMNITVLNLVQAAKLANIHVKGKSNLEVNVSLIEQLKYIREEVGPTLNRIGFREKMYNNKDDIVKAYENGTSTQDLANAWGCSVGTMNTYLKKFGAKTRKPGRTTLKQATNVTGTGKKRGRKKHAK